MVRWPAKLVLVVSAAITVGTMMFASPVKAGEPESALRHVSRELKALEVQAGERRQSLGDLRRQLTAAKLALDRLDIAEIVPAAGPMEPADKDKSADTILSAPTPGQRVHLASFRTRVQAEAAWRHIKQRHGDLLHGLEPIYLAVDFGPPRGLFLRLVIDVAPDRQTCHLLRQRGAYCQPVS